MRIRNINKHKKMRLRLAQQYTYLKTLVDAVPTPTPMYSQDEDGSCLGCNSSFENDLQCDRGEIVGRRAWDLMPKQVAEFRRNRDRELQERGKA